VAVRANPAATSNATPAATPSSDTNTAAPVRLPRRVESIGAGMGGA
jgi:hypothetical protein